MKKTYLVLFFFLVAGCFVSCCPYSVSPTGLRHSYEGYVMPRRYVPPMRIELTHNDSIPGNVEHFHKYLIRFPGKYAGIIDHDFMYGTIPIPNDPAWFSPGFIIQCRHFAPVRERERK